MKQAIGLEDKRARGIGTARVARGRWSEILGWQRLKEQMAPQSKHTHHVGEKGASYKCCHGPCHGWLGKPQIG